MGVLVVLVAGFVCLVVAVLAVTDRNLLGLSLALTGGLVSWFIALVLGKGVTTAKQRLAAAAIAGHAQSIRLQPADAVACHRTRVEIRVLCRDLCGAIQILLLQSDVLQGERRADRAVAARFDVIAATNPVASIQDESVFLKWIADHQSTFPDAYRTIKEINLGLADASNADVEVLESGPNQCAVG